ncbi:MAG TPA: PilZ domain-containing protein, partial [Burkholderiaceae bacterium]|nr:PilZ domain-containing protein [Burkholderiaceae bacterium]
EKIEGCFLDLPGVGSINLSVVVRNLDPVVREDTRRLGCEFADLSPASRMALQRYVNKVETEARKALSHVA